MNMLIENLGRVAESSIAWTLLALLAVLSVVAFWNWYRCPVLALGPAGKREATPAPFVPKAGPRFFFLMAGGIGITLGGLTLIANGIHPSLAFVLLIGGVFVIQTEPARLELSEAKSRALAALSAEAREDAHHRLRAAHRWLVFLHFIILGVTAAGLLAF